MSDATWFTVVAIAFGAQLAVLPGEKVQFIIAGLATRYHPLLVVAAAGTAFAGWTALEVVFGALIQEVLPAAVLDLLTVGMFALFAVLLFRSTPEKNHEGTRTDGGVLASDGDLDVEVPFFDRRVPNVLGGFLPIFVMMAVGEFGDKTQLITITLAGNYPAHPSAIWVGEMLAIVPISLANAYFFDRFSSSFDIRRAHLVGAALFAFFALDTVLGLVIGVSVWEAAVSAVTTLVGSGL